MYFKSKIILRHLCKWSRKSTLAHHIASLFTPYHITYHVISHHQSTPQVHITSLWPRDRPPIASWKIPEPTEREWEKQRMNQTFSWTENYGLTVLKIIWRKWRPVSHLELTSTQSLSSDIFLPCLALALLSKIITVSCWRCCYHTLTSRSTRQRNFLDISLALWCWPVMLVTLP